MNKSNSRNFAGRLTWLFAAGSLVLSSAAAEQKAKPEPQAIELSGRLHRPIKWTPQLKVFPAGQFSHIDLQGDLLRDIKEGTPLRVKGVVHSRLHRGSTQSNPSPFPAQWILWLEVTEMEVLKDVSDILK